MNCAYRSAEFGSNTQLEAIKIRQEPLSIKCGVLIESKLENTHGGFYLPTVLIWLLRSHPHKLLSSQSLDTLYNPLDFWAKEQYRGVLFNVGCTQLHPTNISSQELNVLITSVKNPKRNKTTKYFLSNVMQTKLGNAGNTVYCVETSLGFRYHNNRVWTLMTSMEE